MVGGAVHELADDDPVGALRGVERVPVRVHVPVGAHVGRRRAQPDPVVRALTAARHLGRHEPCNHISSSSIIIRSRPCLPATLSNLI